VLKEAGFQEIKIEVVAKVGAVGRAEDAATGLVQGNPVAVAIAERDPSLLPVITKAVAQAIAGPVRRHRHSCSDEGHCRAGSDLNEFIVLV
jgi:hypothetical protein